MARKIHFYKDGVEYMEMPCSPVSDIHLDSESDNSDVENMRQSIDCDRKHGRLDLLENANHRSRPSINVREDTIDHVETTEAIGHSDVEPYSKIKNNTTKSKLTEIEPRKTTDNPDGQVGKEVRNYKAIAKFSKQLVNEGRRHRTNDTFRNHNENPEKCGVLDEELNHERQSPRQEIVKKNYPKKAKVLMKISVSDAESSDDENSPARSRKMHKKSPKEWKRIICETAGRKSHANNEKPSTSPSSGQTKSAVQNYSPPPISKAKTEKGGRLHPTRDSSSEGASEDSISDVEGHAGSARASGIFGRRRNLYTHDDDLAIIRYVCRHRLLKNVSGNQMWKLSFVQSLRENEIDMIQVCRDHTFQSLQSRWRQKLKDILQNYVRWLTQSQITYLGLEAEGTRKVLDSTQLSHDECDKDQNQAPTIADKQKNLTGNHIINNCRENSKKCEKAEKDEPSKQSSGKDVLHHSTIASLWVDEQCLSNFLILENESAAENSQCRERVKKKKFRI